VYAITIIRPCVREDVRACVAVDGIATQKRCRRLGPGRSYTVVYTNDPFTPVAEKASGKRLMDNYTRGGRRRARPRTYKGGRLVFFPTNPPRVVVLEGDLCFGAGGRRGEG